MLKQCYIMSFVLWDVIAFLQHFNTFCVMCNTDWRHAHTGLEIWTHWNGLDWHALAWTGLDWRSSECPEYRNDHVKVVTLNYRSRSSSEGFKRLQPQQVALSAAFQVFPFYWCLFCIMAFS